MIPDYGENVERIVGKLGEVINSLVFDQIGCKKRIGSHFWTL